MDENVHGQITVGLRLRDVDVLTVQEDEREKAKQEINSGSGLTWKES